MKEINCEFTSVWDDGSSITTHCVYVPDTGEVFPNTSKTIPNRNLIREFITLKSGDETTVCPECHEYIMKTVIGDRADLSYGEYLKCMNPDCEGEC